jgi:protein-tyrosine phosphatase
VSRLHPDAPRRICFVCLGNICRSPMAEAVAAHLARERGIDAELTLDSAGTAAYHVGDPPHRKTLATLARHGLHSDHRGRQFVVGDFARFDLVLAMDPDNIAALRAIAPDAGAEAKIRPLRSFDPAAGRDRWIPDPYGRGDREFELVYRLVHDAAVGLLDALVATGAAAG